jgi:hypothetical protein
MNEQTQQMNRVVATAGEAVLDFIKTRLTDTENTGAFTSEQLRFYVNNNVSGRFISPSTADRVLRDLRQKGKLDYLVLNRGKGLYRAVPIGTTKA